MAQKILKAGTSASVNIDAEFMDWTRGFIEKYRVALESLAKE